MSSTVVEVTPTDESECSQMISFSNLGIIGQGTFGIVCKAVLAGIGEFIAIKTVHDVKKAKREVEILRHLDHCNIVKLKYFFVSIGSTEHEKYLNLMMEFLPMTLSNTLKTCTESYRTLDKFYIQIYTYQLFRGLAYAHSLGICHRDIKPLNLLLHPVKGVLKICDFGSAKKLIKGVENNFYVCSRYYRAPELIFCATDYTTMVDIWSAGCVLAELLHNKPIFPGHDNKDQIAKIIAILGTPTEMHLQKMNPKMKKFDFPTIENYPWEQVFKTTTHPEAIDLVSKLLLYVPSDRCSPLQACAHSFFDELRMPGKRMPNGSELPPLFNFSEHELNIQPSLNSILIPVHIEHCQNNPQAPIETFNPSSVMEEECLYEENNFPLYKQF